MPKNIQELESYIYSNFFLEQRNGQYFWIWNKISLKSDELLDTLYNDWANCARKYAWIYFTWNDVIDSQIMSASKKIKSVYKVEDWMMKDGVNLWLNEKLEKLLFILKTIILKKQEVVRSGLHLAKESENNIESILLMAVDKYSMQDLEILWSFKNITFDTLEKFESMGDFERNQIKEISEILINELWTEIFLTCLDKENIKNIKSNIEYLKKYQSDKLEIFNNSVLNLCFLRNWRWSTIDLLLLPNKYFKIVMMWTNFEINMFSLFFPWYKWYKDFFYSLRNSKLSDDELTRMLRKIDHWIWKDWMIFWIDKGLPLDTLMSNVTNIDISYEHCNYIYENITKDPAQLLELFKYDFEVLQYMYTNVTDNLDEINDLRYLVSGIKKDELQVIYQTLKDFDLFKRLLKCFDTNLEIGPNTFSNVSFLCKTFKDDFVNRLKNNEWFGMLVMVDFAKTTNMEYFYESWLCKTVDDYMSLGQTLLITNIENIKFAVKSWLCKTIEDVKSVKYKWVLLAKVDNVKYLYESWICKTLDDFESIEGAKILLMDIDNIKFLFDNWICKTPDEFKDYEQIAIEWDAKSLDILKNIYEKNDNYEQRFNLFSKINKSGYSSENKNDIIHKIGWMTFPMAEKYVQICEMFEKSNSYDIQVVKGQLITEVLKSDNPEEIIKKVDTIFLESKLPIISKIFQVFKYIYTEQTFNRLLKESSSPYLQSIKTYEKRLETIYKDLMNITIKSGETTLKEYIQSIIDCRNALYDFENWNVLDQKRCRQILSLMEKITSLNAIINNHCAENTEILNHDWDLDYDTLKQYYSNLKRTLLIKKNDSLYTFFFKLCRKIWYSSLEEIITDMEKSQLEAHNNWLAKYNLIKKWELFDCSKKYFLKWIDSKSLWEILNRWVTSTEYLWWWEWSNDKASSNSTPFDTDGVMVDGENVFNVAKVHGHWNLAIIINTNKPRIYDTNSWLQWYNSRLYEIFKNHWDDSDYYWIRTWIASTEFDVVIFKQVANTNNSEKLRQVKYDIAKNWFYLPVLDVEWNLLFTLDEYHRLRQCFSFSDKYNWYDVDNSKWNYIAAKQKDMINEWNEEFNNFIQEQKKWEKPNTNIDNETMAKFVFDKIKDILESEFWIKCNQNKNLLWAELYDSWSTWRWTEIPSNDIDLDFTLLLSADDFETVGEIQKVIHERIWTVESSDHSTVDSRGLQIKSGKNSLWKEYWYENWIQFDLLILQKEKSYLYPSNIAMQDRLDKVENLFGKDKLDFVKENIVIMKKLLKSQWVYKNTEWWIGWIWVENRIMQHHGNFTEALEAFETAAYGWIYEEWDVCLPFEEFKNTYTIRDSWQNFKDWKNDNYVLKMNETGYNWILNIIKKYRTEWLNWISELIKKYQEVKAEFLN